MAKTTLYGIYRDKKITILRDKAGAGTYLAVSKQRAEKAAKFLSKKQKKHFEVRKLSV